MGNVGQAVRREFHGPSKDSAAPFAHDHAEMVKVGKVRTLPIDVVRSERRLSDW